MVFGLDNDLRQPLLAVGEAKWPESMGLEHPERLRRIRELLVRQGRYGAERAKLACFSGAGFTDDLREAADRDDGQVPAGAAGLYR